MPDLGSAAITTVIPTYRRPAMLRRAILSALNQTHGNVRVCVYDNASDDDTREAVAAIARDDERVTYEGHERNIGYARNFLYGMERVKTEFFSLMSDDDVLLPTFYETALSVFSGMPVAGFVATQVVRMTNSGTVVPFDPGHFPGGCYLPPEGLAALIRYGPILWTGVLFRTSIIGEVGLYDAEVGMAGDWEFELRTASRMPFCVVETPGAIFTIHEGSLSGASDGSGSLMSISERQRLYRKLLEGYDAPEELLAGAARTLRARDSRTLVRCWLSSGARGDLPEATRSAALARSILGRKWMSLVMRMGTRMYRYRWCRIAASDLLRLRERPRFQEGLQRKYGELAAHLENADVVGS